MKAPFPYFGGKSRVAQEVWQRFGAVRNYVEPFAGSAAMLLARPQPFDGTETINDADGLVSNFWRSMTVAPEEVAFWAEWPVNEADLHARHLWLVRRTDLTSRLMADPEWCDPTAAGWWVWGACAWIGTGWCSGNGSWTEVDGEFVKIEDAGQGINRQLPHLSRGQGINRQLPHLSRGQGINRQLPHLGTAGQAWVHLQPIAARLRNVRVACGDWQRVCGPTVTFGQGLTGLFLDPPYPEGEVDYNAGSRETFQEVNAWCAANGDNPLLRIAVCGYESDHVNLEALGWTAHNWKANGGYGARTAQGLENSKREKVWFSPHCLSAAQGALF
jgi:site-specific DNA-adenine methylase